MIRHLLLAALPFLLAAAPKPAAVIGHEVGADRQLADWSTISGYLAQLDAESERLQLIELGKTTLGKPFLLAVVADEDGHARMNELRRSVRDLYDVDETDEATAREIARTARPIVAFSLGLHSSEVGAAQASMEMLYELVTREDELFQSIRRELIVLIVPCMNPDGLDIVVDWYRETVGTDAEGTMPPTLYHHYVGHDNNRDGFFNNLAETSLWSDVLYKDWMPQVVIDEHQMGRSGPRLFLPPFDDPISSTVHPLVYSQLAAAGQQVVSDLTAFGHRGIVTESMFTAEWPGSVRSTGFWHNMLGILSEVASARLATPLHFPPGSLSGRGRGLPEYERRANFLAPWEGGWWRLRDIVDLELDLSWSFLRWAVHHDEDLLFNFWQMNRDAVAAGKSEAPYGFVFSPQQHDGRAAARMVEILRKGGVECRFSPGPLSVEGKHYPVGAYVVDAAQPFRPFILELLDSPPYPMVEDGDEIIRPYDVTAWSLPALLGVKLQKLEQRVSLASFGGGKDPAVPVADATRVVLSGSDNRSVAAVNALLARAAIVRRAVADGEGVRAGDFLVELENNSAQVVRAEASSRKLDCDSCWETAEPMQARKVGLYAPWGGSMDEGWTRLLLDRYGFEHERLRPSDFQEKKQGDGARLALRMPVLLFASISAQALRDGYQGNEKQELDVSRWPERFQGGLSGSGPRERLMEYLRAGGTIVAFDEACDYFIEELGLPVRVELQQLSRNEFYAPGTLLRAELDPSHPLAWGSPASLAVYFAGGRSFQPQAWPQETKVVARYAERDLQVAGFLVGGEHLAGRPAMLEIPVGEGRVILFGFSPQRRAQTEATFKLMFNSLLSPPLGP